MTTEQRTVLLSKAVVNNAKWCDAVCAANNLAGVFDDDVWYTVPVTPQYYPNIVTLKPGVSLDKIRFTIERRETGEWFIKDSYNDMDLESLGLSKLFDAEWIVAPSDKVNRGNDLTHALIDGEEELKAWESASEQSFTPALLSNESVKFIAIYSGKEIVAGGIVYLSDDIVGLSNVFTPNDNPEKYWLSLIGAVQEQYPDQPIIDYEKGEELEIAKSLGFLSIGSLSVWRN